MVSEIVAVRVVLGDEVDETDPVVVIETEEDVVGVKVAEVVLVPDVDTLADEVTDAKDV